jgi:hypothetical protein
MYPMQIAEKNGYNQICFSSYGFLSLSQNLLGQNWHLSRELPDTIPLISQIFGSHAMIILTITKHKFNQPKKSTYFGCVPLSPFRHVPGPMCSATYNSN